MKHTLIAISLVSLLTIILAGCQHQTPDKSVPKAHLSTQQACEMDPMVDGPWFSSVVAFEHFDMGRTHNFRCATFSGQFGGANKVTQEKLPQNYITPYNMVTGKGGASFVYAGAYGDFPGAPGSFVAKIDTSGKELWRTQLFDAKAHPERWNYPGVVGIHRNGFVYVVFGNEFAKLDPDSGKVLATLQLPYQGAPEDSTYNGFNGFADGALVMKTVNRHAGCQEQGFSAFLKCENPMKVPNSVIAVVDPDQMKLLAETAAPEPIGGRLTTTRYNGVDRLYLMGRQNIFRYNWDGKTLQLNKNWGPVPYLCSQGKLSRLQRPCLAIGWWHRPMASLVKRL